MDLDTIRSLNRKRGAVKSKLTNFIKFLTQFDDVNSVNQTLFIELNKRLIACENLLSEFDDISGQIETLVGDDEYEKVLHERELFENEFYVIISKANVLIKEVGKHFETAIVGNYNDDNKSLNGSSTSALSPHSRPELPAIPLPSFSGKVENWLEFKDMFESLVHQNNVISNVEKFHYLKKAVQGEALKLIQSRKITSENYEISWQLLCNRYDDMPMLVEYHLDNLINIPYVHKESATDLMHMLDTISDVIYHLEKLDVSVSAWDPLIIHLMVKKLDQVSFLKWEEARPKKQLASLEQFKQFLDKRIDMLKNIERKRKIDGKNDNKNNSSHKPQKSFVSTEECICSVCKGNHSISQCSKYLKMRTYNRYELAKKLKLCLNCLRANHISANCKSSGCSKCGRLHHELLHYEPKPDGKFITENAGASNTEEYGGGAELTQGTSTQVRSVFLDNGEEVEGEVLLSTALVKIQGSDGRWHNCRALLDSGSQPNLVLRTLVERLGLDKQVVDISVVGIASKSTKIGDRCQVNLQSNSSNYRANVPCLVMDSIGEITPSQHLSITHLNIPKNLHLADPNFNIPQKIELLLGSGLFYELLCVGQIKLGPTQPVLQKTRLGWLVTGQVVSPIPESLTSWHVGFDGLQDDLRRFWEIEEIPNESQCLSIEHDECEKIFKRTTVKGSDGRFIVEIPFKDSVSKLGESRLLAVKRFLNLEKKLERNPVMGKMYRDFMLEYQHLGHMSIVENPSLAQVSYYLPHHGVLNDNSQTTKLRVVFDGSATSVTGVSINDLQFTGPKLQDDLFLILVRFRQHQFVVCADIC